MTSKAILVGSVLTSLAASICCIGLLIAIVFGFGTFTAATRLEDSRPYLLGLTTLLITAFYLTYRKKDQRCVGSTCAPSSRMKTLLWVIAAVVIATAAFPSYSGAILQAQTRSSQSSAAGSTDTNEATATIAVSGMTCGSCAMQIQNTLAKTRGVEVGKCVL